jgi:hypothetical protein
MADHPTKKQMDDEADALTKRFTAVSDGQRAPAVVEAAMRMIAVTIARHTDTPEAAESLVAKLAADLPGMARHSWHAMHSH